MKVGLIIYGNLDTLSGGYLYDRKLVEYLRSQGDEVEIISLPWQNYFYHCMDNFNRKFRERLCRLEVEILIQDELNHPSLFLVNRYLKEKKLFPLVSIVHHLRWLEEHPPFLKRLYRQVERRYLNSVDGFICNSQTTLQTVQSLIKVKKPAWVGYPGGDALKVKPSDTPIAYSHNSEVQFLFVGNWIPRKGLHTLLEALRDLRSFEWRLILVGRTNLLPAYERKIQRLIEANGLRKRVKILGAVTDEELVGIWQSADVLVVPSQYEGFGIVYLEAMRFGVIPIGGQNGAAGEIIQNGINGFLVPPNSPAALKDILIALLKDANLRDSLRTAALARFEQFPSWQQSMAAVRKFLVTQFLD